MNFRSSTAAPIVDVGKPQNPRVLELIWPMSPLTELRTITLFGAIKFTTSQFTPPAEPLLLWIRLSATVLNSNRLVPDPEVIEAPPTRVVLVLPLRKMKLFVI